MAASSGKDEPPLVVRRACERDIPAIEAMIQEDVQGHPAETFPRSRDTLRRAYFGAQPVAKLLIAERQGAVIGMAEWRLIYDMFWSKFGGHGEWLFVRKEARGSGVVAAIIAEVCADVARSGGTFLRGGAEAEVIAKLYGRVGAGGPQYYLSACAFRSMAALAGQSPREIVRQLPDPSLNYVE